MTKKFIWYKPEDWKELHSTCYDNVLYLNKKKHVIFMGMYTEDKLPKDCVCWTNVRKLMQYGLENSDMKYLLDDNSKQKIKKRM